MLGDSRSLYLTWENQTHPHPMLWLLAGEKTGGGDFTTKVLWFSVLRKGVGQPVFPRVKVEGLGRHRQEGWLMCLCSSGIDNPRADVYSSLLSEYLKTPLIRPLLTGIAGSRVPTGLFLPCSASAPVRSNLPP